MRVDNIRITAVTGQRGHDGPVRIVVNGVELALHRISGGTGVGETYEGEFFLAGAVRSCRLSGPKNSGWDLRSLDVEFTMSSGDLRRHRAGALAIEPGQDIDITGTVLSRSFEV